MTTAIAFCESDIDPFDEEFLADPLPRLAQLRDLGPVVYLSRYDAHAVARYADVHRALTDWQSLQSGAGVGLSNFNHEEPWRPPSLLLEADPPRHDAPWHVLQQILSPDACGPSQTGGARMPSRSSTTSWAAEMNSTP